MPTGHLQQLMFEEPAGRFALGQILPRNSLERLDEFSGHEGLSCWRCDLLDGDKLTWSDNVYELFGFPRGTPVAREEAVARYLNHSRSVLERIRQYAINHEYGFLIDAEISPQEGKSAWIRILAAPIVAEGRVVGLSGVKRAL